MVAGFVAVGVLTDQARNIGRGGPLEHGADDEQRVEFPGEGFLAAETADQPLDVVRHEPGVLPCVALAVVVLAVGRGEGIERRAESAFRIEAAHEAGLRIEEMAVGFASFEEIVVIRGLAQLFGDLCHGPVGEGVLHVVSHRLVEEVAGDIAVFHAQIHTPLAEHRRLLERLIGLLPVEAAVAFEHGVGQGRDTGIADHAVGFVAHQVPYGKLALLPVDMEHRIGDVGHLLGVEDRHEGLGGAIGVPQRESRIVHERRGAIDLAVGTAVVAVHVAEFGRGDHRVVKRRIENAARGVVRSLDAHLLQLGVPRPVGGCGRRFEVPAGKLGLHVQACILDAHGRNGDLDIDRLSGRSVETDPAVKALRPEAVAFAQAAALAALVNGQRLEGFGEFGREIDPLVFRPARRVAVAADRMVVGTLDEGFGRGIPAAAVLEVEDHGGIGRCREGVFVQADALGGGQLHVDAVAVEPRGVIARTGLFIGVAEIRPHARLGVVLRAAGIGHLPHDGHHRDVEQIADTGAVQVGVAETDDCRVGNVVARRPVPRLRDARGAELYGAERDVGAHEYMAMAARADTHVDILRQRIRTGCLRAGRQKQACAES